MIVQAKLVEHKDHAVLFWTTDDGRLDWISGDVDGIRQIVSVFEIPNLEQWRVSLNRTEIHGAPGQAKSPRSLGSLNDIFTLKRRGSGQRPAQEA